MRTQKINKLALALIVKGADSEAEVLDRCLSTLEEHVDGIFITITQPNKKVEKVANKHKAHISHFEWVNDFAKARNFNFSQVTKEYDYIMWSDADDVWRNPEKIKPTIEAHPEIDVWGVWYLYDFDEYKKPTVVHKKAMIVKNDNSMEWVGSLHEELQSNREVRTIMLEGVDRLHLSNHERYQVASKRNEEISRLEAERNPDDPRVYWNYANSLTAVGKADEALEQFEKFMKSSQSDEEKFLARLRLAEILVSQNKHEEAENQYLIAIGSKPLYPDGYFQLGYYYAKRGMLDKAIEYISIGLPKPIPQHSIIVYNPRDYDYNPIMALANLLFQKGKPQKALPLLKECLKVYPDHEYVKSLVTEMEAELVKLEEAEKVAKELREMTDKEEIRKKIESLSPEVRSHPMICSAYNSLFVKTESSGKDLDIYCGPTTHEWNPEIYETKGFGGSEEAVYYMSREFAKLGWNVTVYNNCGLVPMEKYGVKWKPYWMFNMKDKRDVAIVWRHPKLVDYDINADRIFIDMHDVLPEAEFTEKRLQKINKIFVKSKAHRILFPKIPDEKFVIVPNGLDFTLLDGEMKKDQYLMINTSSPDRSMNVLPELFKRVKEQVPQARLQWAYGWGIYDSIQHSKEGREWKEKIEKDLKDAGIESLGKLNPKEVSDLYKKANILAYPTEFYEIDCISVKKAQAVGCIPVATDFAALSESIKFGVKIHSKKDHTNWATSIATGLSDKEGQDAWVEATVKLLKEPIGDRTEMMKWTREIAWENIAKTWHNVIS